MSVLSRSKWKLDPDAVKARAESIEGCKLVPLSTDAPNLLSFLVGMDEASRKVEDLARINVYVDTGTVGVCRVLQGDVRQTFRRNITSLDVIERLLRHPPMLPAIDKALVSLQDEEHEDNKNGDSSLRTSLELAEVGIAILQGEKEKLENHLNAIQLVSSKPHDESMSSANTTGMEFQFSLPAAAMKHVDQCLNDITKMGKLIRQVATNGKGTVFLYGNGGVAYTPNIPRPLHNKLGQLRNSRMASRPSYVALGTRDRFFVAFNDGSFNCKGPKPLDKELKKLKAPPRSVAFGNAWDSYFIVFDDGSWTFHGRGIPEALEKKLADRQDRSDLVCVNLGPNGEWFLKAKNGRCWWGGVTEDADGAILDLIESGRELNVIDFGEDGSYFVSYD